MRLLDVKTLQLVEIAENERPKYAILSHTWDVDEVSFEDMVNGTGQNKAGYAKIKSTCSLAWENKLSYVWIDTCCIDKKSSAELQEAINSMHRWYANADICYAYLSDIKSDFLDGKEKSIKITESRWFTRGWTLQELIAPPEVIFYSKWWNKIGTRMTCAEEISKSTNIDEDILLKGNGILRKKSMAKRMSWASRRRTTRPEDIAYCLLGLFDVQMPLLYGEGETKAFFRLQEEILKNYSDQSILAWTPDDTSDEQYRGVLALHPREFRLSAGVVRLPFSGEIFSMTGQGLQIPLKVLSIKDDSNKFWGVLQCHEEDNFQGPLAISLIGRPDLGPWIFARDPRTAPQVQRHSAVAKYELTTAKTTIGSFTSRKDTDLYQRFTSFKHPSTSPVQETTSSKDDMSNNLKTILILKNPEDEMVECEHVQVEKWPANFSLVKAIPVDRWSVVTSSMQFRGTDIANRRGVLVYRYFPSNATFAIVFGLRSDGSSPFIRLYNIPQSKGLTTDDLDQWLIHLLYSSESRETTATNAELCLLNSDSTSVKVLIKKAQLMRKPVLMIRISRGVANLGPGKWRSNEPNC